jgi:hypothetical protein
MHDAAIGRGRGYEGVLDQPCEAVADGAGLPAIEAEDELVEVALQVLGPDGAVVRAEQPALGEAEDEVDGGQAHAGVAPSMARRPSIRSVKQARPAGREGWR